MKNWLKGKNIMPLVVLMLFFASSCIDGYKDDWEWSSTVKNATLGSPEADKITVKFSPDGTKQTITWDVVPGAGGYQISVYNIDDPDNPIAIGEENQFVDGVSVIYPSIKDTHFKIVIKTLGNTKNNNKEAEFATEKLYDNLLVYMGVIPSGTNLTEYFIANPIPESPLKLGYQLEAGGNYTMTGNINQALTSVSFIGDSANHAKLNVTNGSFINDGAGFSLQYMDISYADFLGTIDNAVILMNKTVNSKITKTESEFIVVSPPIVLQSCKITGIKYYLFYDNGVKYAIGTFLIKDCIIGQNTNSFANALIRFQSGMLKDFSLTNSTIYNEMAPSHGSNRFMQISTPGNVTTVQATTETWLNGSMTIINNTFFQAGKSAQAFNSNGAMGQATDVITIQKNIFVDCYENGRIISRFRRGGTSAIFTGGQNTQFYNGFNSYTGTVNDIGTSGDVNYFTSDPQLTYLGNGQFTMTGAEQVAARTGDPRWLPAE